MTLSAIGPAGPPAVQERQLRRIAELHRYWLEAHPDGIRADLTGESLNDVRLTGANLSRANLRSTTWLEADLTDANL